MKLENVGKILSTIVGMASISDREFQVQVRKTAEFLQPALEKAEKAGLIRPATISALLLVAVGGCVDLGMSKDAYLGLCGGHFDKMKKMLEEQDAKRSGSEEDIDF